MVNLNLIYLFKYLCIKYEYKETSYRFSYEDNKFITSTIEINITDIEAILANTFDT